MRQPGGGREPALRPPHLGEVTLDKATARARCARSAWRTLVSRTVTRLSAQRQGAGPQVSPGGLLCWVGEAGRRHPWSVEVWARSRSTKWSSGRLQGRGSEGAGAVGGRGAPGAGEDAFLETFVGVMKEAPWGQWAPAFPKPSQGTGVWGGDVGCRDEAAVAWADCGTSRVLRQAEGRGSPTSLSWGPRGRQWTEAAAGTAFADDCQAGQSGRVP